MSDQGKGGPEGLRYALRVKGVSEIMPRFETAFVLACHYAISKLCQYRQSGLRGQQSLSYLSLTNLSAVGSGATQAGFEADFGSL